MASERDDRAALEAPEDAGELYEYLGDTMVPPSRPLNQGDIVRDVSLAAGVELGLVMIMAHPCSMRRGPQLQPELVVSEIRDYQRLAPRKWPNGHYDHLPLPGLDPNIRSTPGAASFRHLHTVNSKELALDKRVAALSDYGQIVLLQRWIHQLSRVTVDKQELTEQLRPVQAEIFLQERWCAAAVEASSGRGVVQTTNDLQIQLDQEIERFQEHLGEAKDVHSLRRRLSESETDHIQARRAILAEIRARFQ